MFNGANSRINYNSFFNAGFESFGSKVIVLSDITDAQTFFKCTIAGIEYPIQQFYIFRRKGFLTTISVQFGRDVYEEIKNQTGAELIIYWDSPNYTGEMANSLIQNISYRQDAKRRIVKAHATRAKKEVAERMFVLSGVEELKYNDDGTLNRITCTPQPAISPEDSVFYDGAEYKVESVKITASTKRSSMWIEVY